MKKLLLCILAAPALAQNPIIPDYVADPSVSKFGDTYYLYATTDIDAGLKRAGTPVVWQSKDFVNWSFEGPLFEGIDWTEAHHPWQGKTGWYRYWAPGRVVERGGTYYLYATIMEPSDAQNMYLLTSQSPAGPFHFADSVCIEHDIDGEHFLDDDGQAWFLWRRRKAARLNAEWTHIEGDTYNLTTARGGYSEGPTMFKRDGIYYYIYTLSGNDNYVNAYMMSRESPVSGYYTPEGNDVFIFSSMENGVYGPGHGNVLYDQDRGEYFFVYLEYGDGGTTRRVYADRMEFNADGTIRTITPSQEGVGYLAEPTEQRTNLALTARATASSTRQPRVADVKIETQPNAPLPDGGSVARTQRAHYYYAGGAIDGTYAQCWQADPDDPNPQITLDLGKPTRVAECKMFFTIPTAGHSWRLEGSTDGKRWRELATEEGRAVRSPHVARVGSTVRYLRLTVTQGSPGLWEWCIY